MVKQLLNKQLYILLLFLVFIFLPSLGLAQENSSSINGKVVDQQGKAIPFVAILLEGTTGTISDGNGKFKFSTKKRGQVQLTFKCLGYEDKIQTVDVLPGENTAVEIKLKQNTQNLDEVVISERSNSTIVEQKGYSATSVALDDIHLQSTDINRVLGQNAGILVRQQGGLGARVSYSINGLEGKAIRFFIDGIPMDYFGSSYSVSSLPTSTIGQVDVYKGVVPIELGSDALGGAINLITKKNLQNAIDLSYSIGSFNTHQAALSGYWRNKKTGITAKLSTFYNYSDNNYKVWGNDIAITDPNTYEVKRGIKVERFHDAYRSRAIKADFGISQKDWADQLFVGVIFSDMDKEIQHGATMEVPFGKATYFQQMAMPFLQYKNESFFDNKLKLNLFSSFSKQIQSRVDTSRYIYNWIGETETKLRILGGEQKRTLNELEREIFLTRANVTYSIAEGHKIGFNQVFSHYKRTDRDPLVTQKTEGYYAPQYFKKNFSGLTFQSKWFGEKLLTSLFVKYLSYSAEIKVTETNAGETTYETVMSDGQNFGYGFASSYKLFPQLVLSTSIEQANRLPEADEILGDGLNIISNEILKPESSLNFNLGVDLSLNLSQHRIKLYSNFFYRNTDQRMKLVSANDPGLFQHVNFDKVRATGVDGRLQYFFREYFSFHQSASYLNPIIKNDEDEFGRKSGLANTRLPNTPFFQATSEIRFHLTPFLKYKTKAFIYWTVSYVDDFYRYSEKYGNQNKDQVPEQLVHSLGAACSVLNKKLSVGANVRNIFDTQVFDNYAVQKPGRSFHVKIAYSIQ